MVAMWRIHSK
jgi:hypothetical protein